MFEGECSFSLTLQTFYRPLYVCLHIQASSNQINSPVHKKVRFKPDYPPTCCQYISDFQIEIICLWILVISACIHNYIIGDRIPSPQSLLFNIYFYNYSYLILLLMVFKND